MGDGRHIERLLITDLTLGDEDNAEDPVAHGILAALHQEAVLDVHGLLGDVATGALRSTQLYFSQLGFYAGSRVRELLARQSRAVREFNRCRTQLSALSASFLLGGLPPAPSATQYPPPQITAAAVALLQRERQRRGVHELPQPWPAPPAPGPAHFKAVPGYLQPAFRAPPPVLEEDPWARGERLARERREEANRRLNIHLREVRAAQNRALGREEGYESPNSDQ